MVQILQNSVEMVGRVFLPHCLTNTISVVTSQGPELWEHLRRRTHSPTHSCFLTLLPPESRSCPQFGCSAQNFRIHKMVLCVLGQDLKKTRKTKFFLSQIKCLGLQGMVVCRYPGKMGTQPVEVREPWEPCAAASCSVALGKSFHLFGQEEVRG